MTDSRPAPRVWILDEVRGLAILLMVFYHTLYDLNAIFGIPVPALSSPLFQFFRSFFAAWFMVISGVACRYSRSNLRRGVLCFGLGAAMTAGTLLFLPSQQIWFGILHFMGSAMVLFWLLRPLLDRIHPLLGVALCVLLYFPLSHLEERVLGLPGFLALPLPSFLYDLGFLFPLGFAPPGFFSADYYPLLPWIFFFLAGSFLGIYFRQELAPPWAYLPHLSPLAWVGRHTLAVYLLHQPAAYLLLTLLLPVFS